MALTPGKPWTRVPLQERGIDPERLRQGRKYENKDL